MKNKKIIWIVAGCLVLLVAVMSWKLAMGKKGEVVAQIGSQTITAEQWEQKLKQDYGEGVLYKMIDKMLVFQKAKQLGISVSEEELKLEMAKMQEMEGVDGESEFFYGQEGLSAELMQEELEYSLLLEELAMKDVHITDAEIQAYYEQNIDHYIEPARAYLFQIVVEKEEEGRQVIRELEGGSDFAALAKERSIDVLSSGGGGEIGWISLDDPYADPSVIEEAFHLPVNKISDPIPTELGYAIIKVTDRIKERQKPLDEVRREIRRELSFHEAEPLPQLIQRLREEAQIRLFLD